MSPRTGREISAIKVDIAADGIGSGLPEQGGGILRGGLMLTNRFTAALTDPAVPYDLTMTVGAHNEMLACESFTITKRPGGPAVTSTDIRRVTIDTYLARIRWELEAYHGGGMLVQPVRRTSQMISFDFPPARGRLQAFEHGQRRGKGSLTTTQVAELYREALRSPREISSRPTEWVAEQLGYSRGHISRILTQARREGLPGLGDMRPPRRT